MNSYPRLIIAGIRGGSGKTTISLGIIRVLRQKGLKVVPFKKGPDYIDAGWLSVAAENPCYNLDPFLITKDNVLGSFLCHFSGDIAIIEGNRGLYDGMDVEGSYSTAELAKLLKSPVLLIIDCTKMTRTSAAIILGCMNLDRNVDIRGVILNNISGSRHESIVRASIEKYTSLPVVGAIPRLTDGAFPERHMGLTPYQEHPDTIKAINSSCDIADKYLDIEAILHIAKSAEPLKNVEDEFVYNMLISHCSSRKEPKDLRIGVIRDDAFQFYYPENLEALQAEGAEIIDIDALKDERLPDIDSLYIGGGFPETNAIRLANNVSFRKSLKESVEKGLPIYAECGGLMFLGDSIIVGEKRYPMAGIFPIVFEMKGRPQAHGYTIVEVERENPFFPLGTVINGHEFHYSALSEETSELHNSLKSGHIYFAFKMRRGKGIKDGRDGICYKNVFASYTHIHALGAKEWISGIISKAKEYKNIKNSRKDLNG